MSLFRDRTSSASCPKAGSCLDSKYWRKRALRALSGLVLLISSTAAAQTAPVCVYVTENGSYEVTRSPAAIPSQYQATSRCMSEKQAQKLTQTYLAPPDAMHITGAVRRESFRSPLGPVRMRWPESAESSAAGKPLPQPVKQAFSSAAAAFHSPGFPRELRTLSIEWNVVLLQQAPLKNQLPARLREHCHPAWVSPPGNIYIVLNRLAEGCGDAQLRDMAGHAALELVLLHEIGHAAEFQLLGGRSGRDPMRAEGFAVWFEHYAAQYSPVLREAQLREQRVSQAAAALELSPGRFEFHGSRLGSARAAMYLDVVVARHGVAGLFEAYGRIDTKHRFVEAVEKGLGWSRVQFDKEVARHIAAGSRVPK